MFVGNIWDAPLKEGAKVELTYPSSADGSPLPRKGEVERVGESFVVVAIGDGQYRTFRFERVVGDVKVAD